MGLKSALVHKHEILSLSGPFVVTFAPCKDFLPNAGNERRQELLIGGAPQRLIRQKPTLSRESAERREMREIRGGGPWEMVSHKYQ